MMNKQPRNRVVQRFLQRFFRRIEREGGPKRLPSSPAPLKLIPASYKDVLKTMVNKAELNTPRYLRRSGAYDWTHTHPDIKRFAQRFQKECASRGIPIWIFETYRSPARQKQLKAQGRSKADAFQSPHQYGCAVDLISSHKLWDLNKKQWDLIGVIGKEIARKLNLKLDWGGDWSFYDPAHWQLSNWRDYQHLTTLELNDPSFIAIRDAKKKKPQKA